MRQNIFSHKPPLYDLFDKAEVRALHPLCMSYVCVFAISK